MTRQSALEWQQIQDGIYAWACQVTGIDWVWANQDTAQIEYPYGVLTVVSGPIKSSLDEIRYDAARNVNIHTGPRQFTIGFQVSVGEKNSNERPDESAEAILTTLQASVQFEATKAIFRAANIAVEVENPIQVIDLQIGTDKISRAALDIGFLTATCIEETIDPIETIVIDSEYRDNPSRDGSDTIDLTGV